MKCPDCGFEDEYWDCDKCAALEQENERLKERIREAADEAWALNQKGLSCVLHDLANNATAASDGAESGEKGEA